jgi:dATP pyrophosphohydrolase
MPEIVSNTVSVYAFKVEAGRAWYLLLRRTEGGKLAGAWQVIHGKVEEDEETFRAAVRELVEETGLAPVGLWSVDFLEHFHDILSDTIRLSACFAAQIQGEPELSEEHDASRWLSFREAQNLCTFRNQREALEVIQHDIANVVAKGAEPAEFLRLY